MWTRVAFVMAFCGAIHALQCLGHESNITTIPNGDIAVLYNDPLNIFCVVEPPYNSTQVRFVQRAYNSTAKDLKNFTEVVNSTTLRLFMQRPQRQIYDIDCELRTKDLVRSCFNKVVVDTPPGNVTDFRCRSYNLERLECRWQTPVHFISTKYHLEYDMYNTPINACVPTHNGNNYTCVLYANKKQGQYRTQEDYYYFTLTSVTSDARFGNNTQNFKVNHFANLIPGSPTHLKKTNLTAHSIELLWRIPQDIVDFSKGVVTRINYQIKTVDNMTTWRSADTSHLPVNNTKSYRYLLKDLPYAHWSYDVRIFIKSVLAPDEEEFWSDFNATTFTTKSERPLRAPRTELGAFVSHKREQWRDIIIYWQQIDEFYESGDNFTYTVKVQDGDNSFVVPSNKSSSVQFKASLQAVNVTIASANDCGESINKSYLYIPAFSQLLRHPTSFTKTVYGNKTYDLRWHPPSTTFDSYTVFWCSNTDVEPCSGQLQFTTLSPNTTSHRVLVAEDEKTYMFAISANRGHLSSGMVWGTCNLPAVNATNKVAVFRRGPVGRRSVELQWDLGCSFSEGHVKGYNVSYCPRADPSHCNSADERFMVINDPQNKTVVVSGLMPHTTYTFHVAVIYKDGLGYNSDSVDATTLEDKPSEPLNIQISQVTAHSMHISWDPPKLKNGILLEYKVIYFINGDESTGKEAKLRVDVADKSTQLKDKRQEITLTDLQAFTNYTIKVRACTTDCSSGAVAGQVRTAIGTPSRVEGVFLNVSNLQWRMPVAPGGTLDLYEVEIRDTDNTLLEKRNSLSLEIINIPQCDLLNDEHSILYYYVRAVNYDKEIDHGIKVILGNVTDVEKPALWSGKTYWGQWSEPAVLKCGKRSSIVLFWILGLVLSVAFVIMLAIGLHRGWVKCQKMRGIKVELPPNLGPQEKDVKGNQLESTWTTSVKKEEKMTEVRTEDEAWLLPPQRRNSNNKDFISSSDSTDSTTLSLTSKEAQERDVGIFDDASDGALIREHTPSAVELTSAPPTLGAAYVTNFTQHDNMHDNYSTSSGDSFEPGLQPGYVQSGLAPLATTVPGPASPPQPDVSTGYVQSLPAKLSPSTFISLPPHPKPLIANNRLAPILLPGMWKLPSHSTEPQIGLDMAKLTASVRPPVAADSSNGYVSHTSNVINKHLNIISNNQLGEEPAVLDPDMPLEAYSRIAWSTDPSAENNLRLLHHDQRPASPH